MKTPSTNGRNGRDQSGRFAPGNAGGPGNPHSRKVALLRNAMLEAVSDSDVRAIIEAMVVAAKEGDTTAAREVLDRTIGKCVQTDLTQRVEGFEQRVIIYIPDNGRAANSDREHHT